MCKLARYPEAVIVFRYDAYPRSVEFYPVCVLRHDASYLTQPSLHHHHHSVKLQLSAIQACNLAAPVVHFKAMNEAATTAENKATGQEQATAPVRKPIHRFGPGNPGRPKGSKNKATAEASGWALPLVPEVLRRRLAHRRSCDAAKDCAMCRHYNDMVLHYAYGKPPQRQELVMATLKSDTEALSKSMGLNEAETKAAVAEAERHYAALKAK